MSLKVALEALRDDAHAWSETSDFLARAQREAGLLPLSQAQLSFASDDGLDTTYAAVLNRMVALLTGGATETDRISMTLLQVRDAYQSTDTSAAAALRGSWEPK